MRLNQFSYLIAISECGSIIDASRKLFVSQPSISAAIHELEAELGFDILIRSNKGVKFTHLGEQVLKSAKTIMREQERIRSLSSKSDLVCGNIAIGGSSFFFDSVILNTIISLQSRYPELIITAKENDTINLFPMVRDKKINIGVVLYSHVDKEAYEEKIRYYRLNSTEVLEDDMIFLVGKNHPLASRGEVPLKEILKYPLALKKSPFQELALAMFQKTNADCDVLFLDDYSSLWKIAAIANKTILSPYIIYKNEKAEDKNLAAVRIADLEYKYSLCFVHNESEYSVAEKSVVEEMRQQCILMNRQ